MCFVDFKKTFDSVWHKALLQKLEQTGIMKNNASCFNIIYCETMNINLKFVATGHKLDLDH